MIERAFTRWYASCRYEHRHGAGFGTFLFDTPPIPWPCGPSDFARVLGEAEREARTRLGVEMLRFTLLGLFPLADAGEGEAA